MKLRCYVPKCHNYSPEMSVWRYIKGVLYVCSFHWYCCRSHYTLFDPVDMAHHTPHDQDKRDVVRKETA